MVTEKTVPAAAHIVEHRDPREELNQTADRLVLEVVSAAEDGYTAVPECQRLIAWLGAEFLPYVVPRFPEPPADLQDLQEILDAMHGSNGAHAAQLALQARSLVFRLL
jgi:hypothetical protein